ncbi:N-acetylmuramoyl-L-alanine amidase [Nonlabens sp.]|uniref:N-acetylmuramoyl-L-alanine amidase n=1 Tax=Nonlabens sp. TaxID=1888209 RepID=UPI003F6A4110
MLLNNRHGSVDSDAYRYGFQGQERDDEVKGEGNSYNYTFRMHDPRLGRFFAVDPLTSKFPYYTPYQFSGNKVIHAIELEGLEEWEINGPNGEKDYAYGPYLNSGSAESGGRPLVGSDGFLLDNRVVKKREKKLEKGSMKAVNGIVLHRTDSNDAVQSLNSFKRGIGTHFLVAKDGTIYQAASIDKITFHVGKIKSECYESGTCDDAETKKIKGYGWSPKKVYENEKKKDFPDRYPYNIDALGIEVVGKNLDQKKGIWEPLTAKQVESVAYLVNLLKTSQNLTYSQIYTHEQLSYKTKNEGQLVKDAIDEYIQDPIISNSENLKK